MRIAILASCPASTILPEGRYKARYKGREHPSPWVAYLAGALAEMPNVELRVFTYTRAVGKVERHTRNGVDYMFIPKRLPGQLDPYLMHIPDYLALRKHIRAFHPDIVQGCGSEVGSAYLATKMKGASVMFIQGIAHHLAQHNTLSPFVNRRRIHYENIAFRRASGVIGETAFAIQHASEVNPSNKKVVIPHGIASEFFGVHPSFGPSFLCVGAVSRTKGSDVVLEAFLSSLPHHACSLVFIGVGPLKEELEETARRAGADARVTFAGRANRGRIMELMSTARALLIGSRMDTSPNVVTEAHAAGLPVIGSDAGGIPDMVEDGVDGYIVPAEDSAAMSERIVRLALSGKECRDMGKCGREKVKVHNDPEAIAMQHVQFYRSLLKNT